MTANATTEAVIISEWNTKGEFAGSWKELNLDAALAAVASIKVSARGHKFTFESQGGTVVHNAITKPLTKESHQRQLGESF